MHKHGKRRKSELRWYKRAAFVIPAALAIGASGVAAAFYIAEGSGTGTTNVPTANSPSSTTLVIASIPALAAEASNGGKLSPTTDAGIKTGSCGCIEMAGWSVTANNANAQVSTLTASVASSGGNVENSANGNAPVPGCLASWFELGIPSGDTWSGGQWPGLSTTLFPAQLPASAHPTGALTLPTTLTQGVAYYAYVPVVLVDSGTSQNACANVSPLITLTAS